MITGHPGRCLSPGALCRPA